MTEILTLPKNKFESFEDETYMRRKHPDLCFTDENGQVTAIIMHNQDELKEITLNSDTYGQLKYLNLADNKSLKKVTFLGEFPLLRHLDLSNCNLQQLTLPKAGLPALEQFYVPKNKLSDIDFGGDFGKLVLVDLSENKLTLLNLSGNFGALQYLYLKDNKSLESFEFTALPLLVVLDLEGAKLGELPEGIANMTDLETIYLNGNDISNVPKAVIGSGERHNSAEDVLSYFTSIKKAEEEAIQKGESVSEALQYLHQSKLFLIGNGMVGKTSIRRKLKDKKAPLVDPEDRTEVIETELYPIANIPPDVTGLEKPIDYIFNMWDFGGQDKYREIQQLFCSPKSLYIFVTSPDDLPVKEDYVGPEYWLSMVKGYGHDGETAKDSPVIYVVNKIDTKEIPVNEKDLVNQFPNVSKFFKISAADLTGFPDFENGIREMLPKISSDVFTDQYPTPWMIIKKRLEERAEKDHHIFVEDYLEDICSGNLEEREAMSWLRILDRIGTVIYFGEHESLNNWIILNPEWMKNALSKVIDKALESYGVLLETGLDQIWTDYKTVEKEKFKTLLLKYKLAFKEWNSFQDTIYIIPSALRSKAPVLPERFDREPDMMLRIVFDPFIPAGTVSKLTVGLFDLVYKGLMWRGNVFFHNEIGSFALVSENWQAGIVNINLFGSQAFQLFQLIRSELQKDINNLREAKLFAKLDFNIEILFNGDWVSAEVVRKIDPEKYGFLSVSDIVHRYKGEMSEEERQVIQIRDQKAEFDEIWDMAHQMNILFLASNPGDTAKLALEKEHSKIVQVVQDNEGIKIYAKFAVSIEEMNDGIVDHKPVIVHFSGHGTKGDERRNKLKEELGIDTPDEDAGLIFHDDEKWKSEILPAQKASSIFKTVLDLNIAPVKFVILNNCYSEPQAIAISQLGLFVLGVNEAIADAAAIKFTRGMYRTVSNCSVFNKENLLNAVKHGLLQASGLDAKVLDKVSLFYNGNKLKLT